MKKTINLMASVLLMLSINYACSPPSKPTPAPPSSGNGNTMSATKDGKPWTASNFGALSNGAGYTAFTGDASDGSSINIQFLQSYTGKVNLDPSKSIVVIYLSPDGKTYGGTNGSITFGKNTALAADGQFTATLGNSPGDSVKFTGGSFTIAKMN